MKRYELAKREGLNWQVVLLQDCETDIKVLTLKSIRANERYEQANKKVMSLINNTITQLDSKVLKENAKEALKLFASKVYMDWFLVFGNKTLAKDVLSVMAKKGIEVPPSAKQKLLDLPDYVYKRATPNMTYNLEYEKGVIDKVNSVLGEQAKEDYSARYSLRATAERQIREEWHEKQLQGLKDKGVKLVWIETHANCSERCEKWQGKLYSLDGTNGTIDGKSYQPLENATDIYETTKAGKVYKNGCISGFNCRHKLKPYTKGSQPDNIPAEVIDRQRDNDRRQREFERKIRQYETRTLGYKAMGNDVVKILKDGKRITARDMYKYNKGKVKEWTDRYIEFSKSRNIPYYPSRLDI